MKKYLPLRPPVYPGVEENYKANLVYTLAWAWIIGVTSVISIMMVLLPSNWMRGAATIASVSASAVICLLLNRQKRLLPATVFFPVTLWFIATVLALTSGGIYAPAVVAYLPVIITSGFLLGGISGVVMAATCIFSALIFVVLDLKGALPDKQVVHTPITLWLAYSVSGLLIAIMQYLVTNHIRSSIQTIVRETDERKNAETRLKESEFNNRMVVQNKILGIAWASPAGRVLNASATFCEMLGYTEDELRGVYFGDFTHPDDVVRELRLLEEISTGKIDSYTIQKRYRHKNGGYFWVELNLTRYCNSVTNDVDFYIGIIQNIQQRKLAEEALKKSEERYRTLVENAVEALVVLDVEKGKFVSVSESAMQLFKMTKEELLGCSPVDISPTYQPDGSLSAKKAMDNITDAINGGKPVFEWMHCDANETPFQCEVRLVRLPSLSGILVRGSIIDITERKLGEAVIRNLNESLEKKVRERTYELEVVNHDLYRFSTMLSHDLRGAIRRIKSFSDILSRRFKNSGEADVTEPLAIIRQDAAKMDGIVTGLLEMSKLGNKPLQFKPVNLDQTVSGVIADLKKQWQHKAHEVNITSLPVINSDTILIQQIFANLLSNAFKYSSKNEVIKVNVMCNDFGDRYVFAVTDNGVGFNMADHDKLFKEFTRLHHDNDFEGTGIGLSSVKRFVEKLGGRIWAESNPLEGSTFYFEMPLQEVTTEV